MTGASNSGAPLEATPKASAMLEAMRGMGYSVEAALADIIDNSIAAEATSVRLDFIWDSGQPAIRVTDNGWGMTGEQLTTAMTLGAINPLHARRASDLGRFGLGLKTACCGALNFDPLGGVRRVQI